MNVCVRSIVETLLDDSHFVARFRRSFDALMEESESYTTDAKKRRHQGGDDGGNY